MTKRWRGFADTYLGAIVIGWSMWIGFGLFLAVCAFVGTVWK